MPARRAEFQSIYRVDNISSYDLETKYDKDEAVWVDRGLWDEFLPAGLRCMGGTSMKRKFLAPALKSSSWALRRSCTSLFGSEL